MDFDIWNEQRFTSMENSRMNLLMYLIASKILDSLKS